MEFCWVVLVVQCCVVLVSASSSRQDISLEAKTLSPKNDFFHKPTSPKPQKIDLFLDKDTRDKAIKKIKNEKLKKAENDKFKKVNDGDKSLDFVDTVDDSFSSSSSMYQKFTDDDEEYYADYEDAEEENSQNFASLIRLIGQPPASFSGFSNTPSIIATNSLTLSSESTVRPSAAYPNNFQNLNSQISSLDGNTHSRSLSASSSSYSSPSSNNLGGGNFVTMFSNNKQTINHENLGSQFSRPSSSHGAPSSLYGAPTNTQWPTTYSPPTQRPTIRYSAPRRPIPTRPRPRPPVIRPKPRHPPVNLPGPSQVGMPYQFEWQVLDPASNNDYLHRQASDGQVTQGQYEVLLPDGRRQIVVFRVDGNSGYQADVRYEGEINPNLVAKSGIGKPTGREREGSYGGAGTGARGW